MSKMHKTFYYARVSTREQNLDRQLEAFRALGADDREIITDKESGTNLDRPGYQALKSAMLRSGDTLVVKSLDRLSRSKADIHSELQWFKQNNIHLKVIDLPTTMMDLPPGQEWVFEMVNNILIEVLGTIAEQERLTIHQRQREGIEIAKAQGKYTGRKPIPTDWTRFGQLYGEWRAKHITGRDFMRRMNMSANTFYRRVREYELRHGITEPTSA